MVGSRTATIPWQRSLDLISTQFFPLSLQVDGNRFMKVAIVSDIHSNLEAFSAVLGCIDGLGVDRIYCLGDIVGYGPNPIEIVNLVRERVHTCILGNHDEALLDEPRYFNRLPYEAIMWTKIQFSTNQEENLAYLSSLPGIFREDGVVLTHGLLDNNMCYVDSTDDLMLIFDSLEEMDVICFGGHSHVPSVWILGVDELCPLELEVGKEMVLGPEVQKVWANVGSVGQPRDGDPRASFMTWDTQKRILVHHRVAYDIATTMNKIRNIPELDNYLAERLEKGA